MSKSLLWYLQPQYSFVLQKNDLTKKNSPIRTLLVKDIFLPWPNCATWENSKGHCLSFVSWNTNSFNHKWKCLQETQRLIIVWIFQCDTETEKNIWPVYRFHFAGLYWRKYHFHFFWHPSLLHLCLKRQSKLTKNAGP